MDSFYLKKQPIFRTCRVKSRTFTTGLLHPKIMTTPTVTQNDIFGALRDRLCHNGTLQSRLGTMKLYYDTFEGDIKRADSQHLQNGDKRLVQSRSRKVRVRNQRQFITGILQKYEGIIDVARREEPADDLNRVMNMVEEDNTMLQKGMETSADADNAIKQFYDIYGYKTSTTAVRSNFSVDYVMTNRRNGREKIKPGASRMKKILALAAIVILVVVIGVGRYFYYYN